MIDAVSVKVNRERTRMLYAQAASGRSGVPTVLLDLLMTFHHRLTDIEDALGYVEETTESEAQSKVDTQGR